MTKTIYNGCGKKDITWKIEPLRINVKFRSFTKPDFQNLKQPRSPLSYFQYYISDHFIETVTNMTNLYAVQNNLKFKLATPEEIKTYFGLQFSMGSLKLPRRYRYWQEKYRLPLFVDSMTREQLFAIRSCLHFVKKLEIPPDNRDKFVLVRLLFDTINTVCNT